MISHRFFLLLISLLLASSLLSANTLAEDCAYKFPVSTQKSIERLTWNGQFLTNPLEVRNIRQINVSSPCWMSFDVYNTAPVAIRATIRYSTQIITSTNSTIEEHVFYGAVIEPQRYKRLNEYSDQATGCNLINDSVTFVYESTNQTSLQMVKDSQISYECVECTAKECSSGLCYQGYCTQACPEGTSSCNGICEPVATKNVSEPYICDFECKTHLGNGKQCVECLSDNNCLKGVCNIEQGVCTACYGKTCKCELLGSEYRYCEEKNICILPGTKENGDIYQCEAECKSGYGTEGVCSITPMAKAIRITIGVLILAIVLVIFNLWRKNNKLTKDIKKKESELQKVQSDIDNRVENKTKIVRQKFIDEAKRLQEEHKKEQNKLSQEIAGLHNSIHDTKRAREEVINEKRAAENAAREAKAQLARDQRELAAHKSIIQDQKSQLQQEKIENLKLREELENDKKKYFEECLTPYPSPYANNRLVIRNPYLGGYECFYKEGQDPKKYSVSNLVHRWVWQQKNGRPPKLGHHIHHKDGNKYNNSPENLEELDGDEHFKEHSKNYYRNT